ncbi:MAG: peptidylprolyl isomerase [Lachnospiraceae bacterium]|nr:peptidylprolyl isomerase [Lachnospiraceae bacterium]
MIVTNQWKSKCENKGNCRKSGRAVIKRKITMLLAGFLCMVTLTGCGNGDGKTKIIFTTGFAKDEVFTIEDISCRKPELMVYLSTVQNQYEDVYGEEIWNTALDGMTLEENVKDTVLARIAQIKTMYLLAEEKEVTLEEAEEKKVLEAAEEYYTSLSEKEIELLDISKETVEEMYREYALADKVYHQIIQDVNPEISDDEARTIKVQYIFFGTTHRDGAGNHVAYSEAEKSLVYQEAEEVRALALSEGADFAELATRYSDDTNITIAFGKGDMDADFESTAFNLETDEISEIVETQAGYYIIKCLSTFDREETDANKLKIVEQRKQEVFGEEYDAFVKTLVRNINEDLWAEISLIHDEELKTSNFFLLYDKYFPR